MPPSMLCRRGVMPQDMVWHVEPYQAVLQEVRSVKFLHSRNKHSPGKG